MKEGLFEAGFLREQEVSSPVTGMVQKELLQLQLKQQLEVERLRLRRNYSWNL